MKEILIQNGFEKWLSTIDLAPYPSMFFEIPKFIQYSYIQKYFREVHNIGVLVDHAYLHDNSKVLYCYCVTTSINYVEGEGYTNYGGEYVKDYETALELGLIKACELL